MQALPVAARPYTTACWAAHFVTHPLMTLKVMAGIHLEALRLWLKVCRFTGTKKPASL